MPTHYIGMSRFTEQFPILEEGLYFNHAAIGPWPAAAGRAASRFALENVQSGPADYRSWIRREAELRKQLTRLVGAATDDDIALLKNTTEGISTVAWGLDWRPGDNIVLPAGEFPSNHLPWAAQQAHGVTLRIVDIRSAENAEAALLNACDHRTRVLAVSAVQWNDGFRLDLASLGSALQDSDTLFFVDAIQQLGALRLDVSACHIDALAADAHKWMLGPEGIAVFFCSSRWQKELSLQQQGWHMFDNPWAFGRTDWTPSETARRFEAGSPNSIGQAILHASLSVLEQTGYEEIEQRVLRNTDRLSAGIAEIRGVQLCSRLEEERRSGIVSFRPEHESARACFRRLEKRGVSCAERDGLVRLAPHYYQGSSEIDRVLDRIL